MTRSYNTAFTQRHQRINMHHRHSILLGDPLSTEVLQCIGSGIALGNSFRGAIPSADDDTPDWNSREHGGLAKQKPKSLTGVCPSVYGLVIRARLLSCKTQKSRQILWRLNLLQVVVKVTNRIWMSSSTNKKEILERPMAHPPL